KNRTGMTKGIGFAKFITKSKEQDKEIRVQRFNTVRYLTSRNKVCSSFCFLPAPGA
ncbi:hypothetical protein FRX31_005883, partial [Thalictrum thalictroides]